MHLKPSILNYPVYLCLGMTSLIWAVIFKSTDIVKILLEHGADIKTKNKAG